MADHLAGLLGLDQQPGIDEHIQAAGDKSVECAVVYEVQPDALGAEARCLEQWRGVGADGIFDLRIANQLELSSRHPLRQQRAEQEQQYAEQGNGRFAQGSSLAFHHLN